MTDTPSQQAVDEALREIDGLIESIGDQTVGTLNAVTDDDQNVTGRQVKHGGHVYAVIASPAFRHVKIQASFDAAEAIAISEVQESTGGQAQKVQPSQAAIQSARSDLRDDMDSDEISRIRSELINRVSVDDTVIQLTPEGDAFTTGFAVEDRLFVYDRDIELPEFSSRVQSAINVMWRGKEFLVDAYDVRDAVNGGQSEPRAFQ